MLKATFQLQLQSKKADYICLGKYIVPLIKNKY